MDHSEIRCNANVFNWFRICQLRNIVITVMDIGIHIFSYVLKQLIIPFAQRSTNWFQQRFIKALEHTVRHFHKLYVDVDLL